MAGSVFPGVFFFAGKGRAVSATTSDSSIQALARGRVKGNLDESK
jgi:hypothetical protein